MSYRKGCVALSESQDYPLLRQVLRSQFVTHTQLFEFMTLGHYEHSRSSFNWRLRRLVTSGLVVRHNAHLFGKDFVYSISPRGARQLEGAGEYYVPLPTRRDEADREPEMFHCVELNAIHLSALRAGVLSWWVPEVQVRSQNELTRVGYAKDYDAVLTFRLDGREAQVALEYERTAKGAKQYERIADNVRSEQRLDQFLYLIPNQHLLSFVSSFFSKTGRRVYFGLVSDWHSRLLDMPVLYPAANRTRSLRDALV